MVSRHLRTGFKVLEEENVRVPQHMSQPNRTKASGFEIITLHAICWCGGDDVVPHCRTPSHFAAYKCYADLLKVQQTIRIHETLFRILILLTST